MQWSMSIILLLSLPCNSISTFLHNLPSLPQSSFFSSRRRKRGQSCFHETLWDRSGGGKIIISLFSSITKTGSINNNKDDNSNQFAITWDEIRNPNFDVNTLPPSISHLLSTPELYAHAYNMTINEINQYQINYKHNIEQMKETSMKYIKNGNEQIEGKEIYSLQCKVRYTFGRDPFVCKRCWTYYPICVCERAESKTISKPRNVDKVIIWTHLDEWGKTSNTGSIVNVTIGDDWCNVWMKGLEYHDELMRRMLEDEMVLPIVLWPKLEHSKKVCNDNDNNINKQQWMTAKEIEKLIEIGTDGHNQPRKIVLIAIEGTWRNARRMVKKLPPHVKRLDLKEHISCVVKGGDESILHPLRSQGDGASKTNVCTAEAVVAALVLLGLSKGDGKHILDVAATKIDLVSRFQGKIISQLD
jgi:DTW domain-containing protein YfiP